MRLLVLLAAATGGAAGLECPGVAVADVAAKVEGLGANASTAAIEAVLKAAVAASGHARAHRRVALVKTHKTASGTLQAMVARFAVRLGLSPAAATWPGKFFEAARCPEKLRSALRVRRSDVSLRHVFPINEWWTDAAYACAPREAKPWFDGFVDLCRDLVGHDVAVLLPLREPSSHLESLLGYYNRSGLAEQRCPSGCPRAPASRGSWNPLAKDLRLLSAGAVAAFVDARLRAAGAPGMDAAGVHVLVVEDLAASLAVLRRRLRWSLVDVLPLAVGATKRRSASHAGRRPSPPAAALALDRALYAGALAAHDAAAAAVDRKCRGSLAVAAEARLIAALTAAVDRECGAAARASAPRPARAPGAPLLARLCQFKSAQERAVVAAVVAAANAPRRRRA